MHASVQRRPNRKAHYTRIVTARRGVPHTTPNTLKPLRRADEHWLSEVRVGNCARTRARVQEAGIVQSICCNSCLPRLRNELMLGDRGGGGDHDHHAESQKRVRNLKQTGCSAVRTASRCRRGAGECAPCAPRCGEKNGRKRTTGALGRRREVRLRLQGRFCPRNVKFSVTYARPFQGPPSVAVSRRVGLLRCVKASC